MKIAVVPPIPKAKVSIAAAVNTGDSRNCRAAYRKLPNRFCHGNLYSVYATQPLRVPEIHSKLANGARSSAQFRLVLFYRRFRESFVRVKTGVEFFRFSRWSQWVDATVDRSPPSGPQIARSRSQSVDSNRNTILTRWFIEYSRRHLVVLHGEVLSDQLTRRCCIDPSEPAKSKRKSRIKFPALLEPHLPLQQITFSPSRNCRTNITVA